MGNPGSVAIASLILLAGCTSVVVPESATSSSASGSAGSPSTTTGCLAHFNVGGAPAESGDPDGEGGAGAGAAGAFVAEWATGLGFGGITLADVAVDGAGDLLVVGSFVAAADLGPGVTLSDAAGGGFLAKLDAEGSALWAKEVSPTVAHVYADAQGGAWITDDLGGSTVTGFDPQGNLLWVSQPVLGGLALRVAPGGDGGAILGGTSAGADQLVRVDAAGHTLWTRSLEAAFWDAPATDDFDFRTVTVIDFAAAPGGGVVVLASASETFYADDDAESCGDGAALLLRLDAQGEVMWRRSLVSPASALAVDALGDVLLEETVDLAHTGDLGHGKFYGGIGLAMFDPGGQPRWGQHFAGQANVLRPVFDAAGNIFMAGAFVRNIDFGGGPLQGDPETQRLFVVELSPHGQHLASRTFAGTAGTDTGWLAGEEGADAMALTPDGAVLLVADYRGTLDLGTGALPAVSSAADGSTTPDWVLARISQ